MDNVEEVTEVLRGLPDRMGAVEERLARVEGQIVQLRSDMTAEFSATRASLREEIKAGDEETRRLMRVLHEEVLARLSLLGEGRR